MLKSHCELDTTSTFIDIGAGLGKPNFHVALDPGVKASVGVELGGERWWQSQDILWHGLDETTAKETGLDSLNGPLFLAHADFLEINTLPGLTATSLLPKSASCVGYDFEGLAAELVRAAMQRFSERKQSVVD